jgi:Rrf2 family transcriptional regulator, cysteine metabolism repressor
LATKEYAVKLSTRPRYGLRALLDIATHSQSEPIRLKEIARRQDVSLSYLEHIVGPLISGGILRSTRGPGGGVALLRRPGDIPLAEVMQLLEGPMSTVDCVLHPGLCARSERCATRTLWTELAKAMQRVLDRRTLADLMQSDDSNAEDSCAPDAFRRLSTPITGPGFKCKQIGGDGS